MTSDRKGVEIYVGLFLILGLFAIGYMVVRFGGVGEGLGKTYPVTVELSNASGLIQGAPVLLAGAPIGRVAEKPSLLVREGFGVSVKLAIREDVRLPRDVTIVVDQAGLLGDVYVDVIPPDKIDPRNLIEPGETIVGSMKPGLGALQQKGSVVLSKLADEIDEFKRLTVSMNERLLSEKNLQNLSETFEHLRTTSENLSASSKKLDGILDKGDAAVASAKATFDSAEKAATDLQAAMIDFKKLAQSANKTVDSAKEMVDTGTRVLKKADQGQGALGMLLSDKETAANLKAFAENLRKSGPVFYKDRAEPEPRTQQRRRR